MAHPAWPWPRLFAHRCGGGLAPENTLAGLDAAAACGCRGVEFDVMLSADGTPFLIHDETLERTTSGRGRVAETGDAELLALDAGSWFARRFAGERLPTLAAAARRCLSLGLAVNLEIKPSAGQEAATGRVAATCAAELWRGVPLPPLLSSFSETALTAAAKTAPALPRGLLVEAIPADWRERCARVGAIALHFCADGIDADTVRALRHDGPYLVAYTENDPCRIAALLAWGVDAVITDRPELVATPATGGPIAAGRAAVGPS